MADNVYKIIELVGTSSSSVEEAIQGALAKAHTSVRLLRWFTVSEIRGAIEDGKVGQYQVTLKAGFRLD